MAYRMVSEWALQTMGGYSLGKGISGMGLAASCGVRRVDFTAIRYERARGKVHELKLSMSLAGMQCSVEKSIDLIESFTGAQVAIYKREKDRTALLLNEKNPTDMRTTDFLGPCVLASYDVAKVSAAVELKKLGGATMLYLGMGTTIVDQGPNWLERVVDNADRGTLGGNYMKFNAPNLPWCNARAASRFGLNEITLGLKAEVSIALFSGQVTVAGMRSY